jgi:hypothetical protein
VKSCHAKLSGANFPLTLNEGLWTVWNIRQLWTWSFYLFWYFLLYQNYTFKNIWGVANFVFNS